MASLCRSFLGYVTDGTCSHFYILLGFSFVLCNRCNSSTTSTKIISLSHGHNHLIPLIAIRRTQTSLTLQLHRLRMRMNIRSSLMIVVVIWFIIILSTRDSSTIINSMNIIMTTASLWSKHNLVIIIEFLQHFHIVFCCS